MPFDLFAPGAAQTLVLLGMRVSGLVLIAPVFSSKLVPGTIRAAVVILLTALLAPVALAETTTAPRITPETFVSEMLVGLALGLGAAVVVGAASLAGDIMGMQVGLSGAAVLDPINNSSENVLGVFGAMFATTLLLAVDAHLVMIDAVARSVQVAPVGGSLHAAGVFKMVRDSGMLFGLGLQFAAPVVAAVLVANTALAILSRAAPQLNILSVAFPVQIGIGLVALGGSIPFVAAFYRGWSGFYTSALDRVFASLVRGAP